MLYIWQRVIACYFTDQFSLFAKSARRKERCFTVKNENCQKSVHRFYSYWENSVMVHYETTLLKILIFVLKNKKYRWDFNKRLVQSIWIFFCYKKSTFWWDRWKQVPFTFEKCCLDVLYDLQNKYIVEWCKWKVILKVNIIWKRSPLKVNSIGKCNKTFSFIPCTYTDTDQYKIHHTSQYQPTSVQVSHLQQR